MLTGTQTLASVCAIVVAWIYLRFYLRLSPGIDILQTSISNPNIPDVLRERYPIVLDEAIVDLTSIFATILRFQYCWRVKRTVNVGAAHAAWSRCFSRYTVIVLNYDGGYVEVRHPLKAADIVRIKLRRDQPLLLPPRWLYRPAPHTDNGMEVKGGALTVYDTYDWLHLVLRPFAALLLTHK